MCRWYSRYRMAQSSNIETIYLGQVQREEFDRKRRYMHACMEYDNRSGSISHRWLRDVRLYTYVQLLEELKESYLLV